MKTTHIASLIIALGIGIITFGLWQSHSRQQAAVLRELKEMNSAREMREAIEEGRRRMNEEIARKDALYEAKRARIESDLQMRLAESKHLQEMADMWKGITPTPAERGDLPTLPPSR